MPVTPVLIIVHPGSACGSADMNLGSPNAENQRLDMQEFVEAWEGAIVVIDGELSSELEDGRRSWMEWGKAIQTSMDKAEANGFLATRVLGDDMGDYTQMDAARDLVKTHGWTPQNATIALTGAWIDDEGGGCVMSVKEALEEFGFQPTVECAMNLDAGFDEELGLEDEAPEEAPRSRGPKP